jgi:hypothetical protein
MDNVENEVRTVFIPPVVGRVVWYFENSEQKEPLAAQISRVHEDGRINIGFLDRQGMHHNATNVRLIQGGEDEPVPTDVGFCVWMPYQKGQAAKTEAAEAEAARALQTS